MVMHRHRRTGRNRDFEHAYKPVFENYPVTLGRGLDSVEAVGEIRFVLSINVIVPGKEKKATEDECGAQRSPSGMEQTFPIFHCDKSSCHFVEELRLSSFDGGCNRLEGLVRAIYRHYLHRSALQR